MTAGRIGAAGGVAKKRLKTVGCVVGPAVRLKSAESPSAVFPLA
jgi:hypothetical protein